MTVFLVAGPASAQAILEVQTSPISASVRVDGISVGTTPIALEVAPGRHVIEVRRPRFQTLERTVVVADGDTTRVVLLLPPAEATVVLEGAPPGARIVAAGERVEGTMANVPVGSVTVTVEVDGELDASARFAVDPEDTVVVSYLPRSLRLAAIRSNVFLPGSVQIKDGRSFVGVALASGTLAALTTAVVAAQQEGQLKSDLAEVVALEYDQATSENEVAAALQRVDAAFDRVASARGLRSAALGAAVVIYAVSLADAFLNHARRPVLEVGPVQRAGWSVGTDGGAVVARLSF